MTKNIHNMKKFYNILVFPGGTEIGMEIHKSLVSCKNVCLFSASNSMVNHASYIYKNHYVIKDINTEGWVNELNNIIKKEKIDFVFPAHAFVIDALAKNRDAIKARLMLCSNEVLLQTRSKRRTYEMFKEVIPVPTIFSTHEDISHYPVFVKPDNFYGGQGTEIINNKEYLKDFFNNGKEYIISEYLEGDEYTIDCFSDKNGEIAFCEGRTRQRIRMGTSMHSEKVSEEMDEYFLNIAKTITDKLKIIGPWFFQMKKDKDDNLKLLEIEPRIAGTMAFHRVKGINFPLLFLYTLLGYDIDILTNNFEYQIDRALVNRYCYNLEYDSVYIDLDDTIIIHNRLNLDAIKFIYQCINSNKKIVLLSKSLQTDKNAYLTKWKIENLFDKFIWLKEEESKADFIAVNDNPIFIDDSFSQRKDVSEKLNIPTFDPSMIEILLDERA